MGEHEIGKFDGLTIVQKLRYAAQEGREIIEPWQMDPNLYDEAANAIEEWIAYADKIEAALKLATGQRNDTLMRMHAEQGLRLVRPA